VGRRTGIFEKTGLTKRQRIMLVSAWVSGKMKEQGASVQTPGERREVREGRAQMQFALKLNVPGLAHCKKERVPKKGRDRWCPAQGGETKKTRST